MSIENPTLAHFRHFSSLFTNLTAYKAEDIYVPIRHLFSVFYPLSSTSVESPLQINPFMQNKPNFQDAKMNINSYNKTAYENKYSWTLCENKPNLVRPALFAKELPDWSNPIKACPERIEFTLSVIEGNGSNGPISVKKCPCRSSTTVPRNKRFGSL